MSNNVVLKASKLSVGYGEKSILENISLKVLEGDLVCLMGPNGSGKSTLLKTAAGLLKPLNGEIEISGQSLKKLDQGSLSKLVSIVLTERNDITGLTVEDIVRLGRFPHTNRWGKLEEKDRRVIKESIELMKLGELRNNYASELSDGQLQKVFIARALAQDTPVIVLDEPTTFLDIANKMELMSELQRVSKEKKKALIYSSHDWELVLEMCPKVWLIEGKDSIQTGAPEDFILNGSMQKQFMHERFYLDNKLGRFREFKTGAKEVRLGCDNELTAGWVENALGKIGYKVSDEGTLSIVNNDGKYRIEGGSEFENISSLLDYLKLR